MSSARHDYRVVVVDDHALFAEALEFALDLQGYDVSRVSVADGVGSVAALTSQVLRLRPRTVLLDLHLGRLGDSTPMIAPLAEAGINVVMVTAAVDQSLWGACLRQGARKVISKSAPLSGTLAVVRRLHQGQQVLRVEEREHLLDQWQKHASRHAAARGRLASLTDREREVLGELMAGHSVRDIASSSFVSEATVRTQVKSILSKLEVSSQLAAVGLAHEVNWRPPQTGRGLEGVSR